MTRREDGFNRAALVPYPGEDYPQHEEATDTGGFLSSRDTGMEDTPAQENENDPDDHEVDTTLDPNAVMALDGIDRYIQNIKKVPLLRGRIEERALAKRIEKGDLAAKERFIEGNLRLVSSWAQNEKFKNRGLDLEELIQAGNVGLIRAVEKFDWRKNVKFSTYAIPWIDQAIERALAEISRTIRLPDDQYKRHRKVISIHTKHSSPTRLPGEKPLPNDEVHKKAADEAGISTQELQEVLATWYGQQPDYLDRPLTELNDFTLGDTISAHDLVFDEPAQPSDPRLIEAINALPDKNKGVIVNLFGIEGVDISTDTLAEVRRQHKDTIRKQKNAAIKTLEQHTELLLPVEIDEEAAA